MTWGNLLWLGVGVGIGLLWAQWRRRSHSLLHFIQAAPIAPETATPTPPLQAAPDELAELRSRLATVELAYHMAAQMSQVKGSFLARTSHELRSPLNGLIGMHQLILADLCDSPEEEREFLTEANASALKMVRVLDDVIETSKIEQGSIQLVPEAIAIAALFADVQTLTHLQAQNRSIRLAIAPPTAPLTLWADLRRLRHALATLINSAIATLDEGHITLAVGPPASPDQHQLWLDTPLAAAHWEAPAPPALPPTSDRKAILQTLRQAFPSPSYALTVARSLFQSMHGDLTLAHPTPDSTRICCTLPIAPPTTSID